jgi:hypothetical protein
MRSRRAETLRHRAPQHSSKTPLAFFRMARSLEVRSPFLD